MDSTQQAVPGVKRLATVGELFSTAWATFSAKFTNLMELSLLIFIPMAVFYVLADAGKQDSQYLVYALILLPIILIVSFVVSSAFVFVVNNTAFTLGSALSKGVRAAPRVLAVSLLIALVLVPAVLITGGVASFIASTIFAQSGAGLTVGLVGVMLVFALTVILVAMVLSTWVVFAVFISIEEMVIVDAIARSMRLVRGVYFSVLGRILLMTIILVVISGIWSAGVTILLGGNSQVGSVVSQLPSLVISPFMVAYMYTLYTQVRAYKA